MSKYFENFPVIDYGDIKVKNLLVRIKLLDQASNNRTIYHPFTVIDGETAHKIAYDYYGSADYVWVIWLINNIIDPYYDWPLSTVQFENHVKSKYGSLQAAQSKIMYYVKTPPTFYVSIADPTKFYSTVGFTGDASQYKLVTQNAVELRISADTYARNPDLSYSPLSAYDFEMNANENKRNIRLLDRAFIRNIDDELRNLLT